MSLITKIILILIVLHLVLGFGSLIFKLSPRKEDHKTRKKDRESDEI